MLGLVLGLFAVALVFGGLCVLAALVSTMPGTAPEARAPFLLPAAGLTDPDGQQLLP